MYRKELDKEDMVGVKLMGRSEVDISGRKCNMWALVVRVHGIFGEINKFQSCWSREMDVGQYES